MTLDTLLPIDHVVAKLRAGDKGRLLTELAGRVATLSGIPAAEIVAALVARERLGSTGVGSGIAVPHARIEGLSGMFGLFARLDRAVEYDAIDSRPVDLVFLLMSPAQGTSDHLAALAAVSRRLRDRAIAEEIRGAKDAEQIRAALVR